jgi:hypothetical protein
MAEPDDADGGPARVSRGVRFTGSDFRISGLSIELDPSGAPLRDGGLVTVELRTDTWHYWLREAIDAAIAAAEASDAIPETYDKFEAGETTEDELDALADRELIATMQAIGASAFALDAFYAAVKARSPRHPDEEAWKKKRTARHKQVTETFFYHLKVTKQKAKKEIRLRVSQLYAFRDKAVHPPSEYRDPIYRPDLNVAVDQIFTVFRRENAVGAAAMVVSVFDYLVSFLDNGSAELVEMKPGARKRMNAVLDQYEAAAIFPEIVRREPPGPETVVP